MGAVEITLHLSRSEMAPLEGVWYSFRIRVASDCPPAAADAMRFNGPAPETINGRLAMVGFVTGALNEFQTARTLEEQVPLLACRCACLEGTP